MSISKSHSLAGTIVTVTVHIEQEDVTDAEAYEAVLAEIDKTLKPAEKPKAKAKK